MDSDGGSGTIGGGIGMAGGDGGIGMAGGSRGRNELKLEAESRRKAQQRLPQAVGLPPLRVFADGSTFIKDCSNSHSDLFDEIVDQTTDICWALVLALILQYAYNKDRPRNQRETLDVEGFARKVKLTNEEILAHKKLDSKAMAVGSLKKAMNHISSVGIERADGRKRPGQDVFTVKGVFVPAKASTPEEIVQLFDKYGPLGITVDLTPGLLQLKEGIYMVPKPRDGVLRHALTIVGYGMTKDDKIFFGVINTWGERWGVKGHGRIMIEGTTDDIFFLGELK